MRWNKIDIFNYKHQKHETFKKEEINFQENFVEAQEVKSEFIQPLEWDLRDLEAEITTLRKNLNEAVVQVNAVFDSELISDVLILQSFMKSYLPELPDYLTETPDGNFELSLRAFSDASDYLTSQFIPKTEEYLLDSFEEDRTHYADGFSIDRTGRIFQDNRIILDPSKPEEIKVFEIDFERKVIGCGPGVFVSFERLDPRANIFIEELLIKNGLSKDTTKIKIQEKITVTELANAVGADLENFTTAIKDVVVSPKLTPEDQASLTGINSCNLKKINFFYLMLLLILGGGKEGKKPLPDKNRTDCRSSKPSGCSQKTYATWHPMMWDSKKRIGLRTSILQIAFMFFKLIFWINVPALKIPWAKVTMKRIL